MPKVLNISDTESISDEEDEMQGMQKVEGFGYDTAGSRHIGDNVASSSGTNLRSSFLGMGFSPSLIDKVIEEKGEEDADVLLDALFAHSALEKSNSESSDSLGPLMDVRQKSRISLGRAIESNLDQGMQVPKSTSSDSLDSLLGDDKSVEAVRTSPDLLMKEEPEILDDLGSDKRALLLMMNFAADEVDFAINKIGMSAPMSELVDFITAAQIAENCNDSPNDDHAEKNEDNTEALFGTMDKTLQLLAMGFNEHEVSLAIEKLGSGVPIIELANCICATQMGESYLSSAKNASVSSKVKCSSLNGSWYLIKGKPGHSGDIFSLKTEDLGEGSSAETSNISRGGMYEGIKPKEEYYDESSSIMRDINLAEIIKGKRPKEEFEDDFSTFGGPHVLKKSKYLVIGNNTPPIRKTINDNGMPNLPNPTRGRVMDKMLCGPPYFLYGNVVNLSKESWKKATQFLYALEPEFFNAELFSALNRKEGYIHNLPGEDRFRVQPKSPMTIEEAMPHTKNWWPSWDTRKKLSCITCDTTGTSQICSQLGKMLRESKGLLSGELQTKVLHYCRNMNLVWAGRQKLGPIEPEFIERILGYPVNHTQNPDLTMAERLEFLKSSFQTDTLGYHLSVLRPLFPGGLNVLSIYSGIGGAEVILHRLGIYMKAVVSVESSEKKRKILRRWWQNTDQTGELVQIEDIHKLTSKKLEYFMEKFGAFDLVICQDPCSYPEKDPKVHPVSNGVYLLDFTMYYEFVRVLQRVRTMAGRT